MNRCLFSLLLLVAPLIANAEMGWSRVDLRRAPSPVVHIEDHFGNCTGTRISRRGHILTARHCLHQCLITSGQTRTKSLYPGSPGPTIYEVQLKPNTTCKFALDGVTKEVEVIATGRAFLLPSDQRSLPVYDWPKYQELLRDKVANLSDYAVIRELNPPAASQIACLPTADLPPPVGASVSYQGYPSASTGRGPDRDSNGVDLLESRGQIAESILTNSCLNAKAADRARITVIYDRPEQLISTVDLLPGASGAALVDHQGKVAGVLFSVFSPVNLASQYCAGSATALKIDYIRHEIAAQFKETLSVSQAHRQLREIFQCAPSRSAL